MLPKHILMMLSLIGLQFEGYTSKPVLGLSETWTHFDKYIGQIYINNMFLYM